MQEDSASAHDCGPAVLQQNQAIHVSPIVSGHDAPNQV